jgi:predicted RNA-binding Zn ribbon-like protein
MRDSNSLIGGSPWVNLANTKYISKDQDVDILDDRKLTISWLLEDGLVNENDIKSLESLLEQQLLDKLLELRSICKSLLIGLEKNNQVLKEPLNQLKEFGQGISLELIIEITDNPTITYIGDTLCEDIYYRIIRSIIDTFNKVSIDRIRACDHEDCILYFIDTSKAGKRRWCSMDTCGNRKKALDFYARNRQKSN